MSFSLKTDGKLFPKTTNWLDRLLHGDFYAPLDRIGQMGVDALAAATPKETGLTSESWSYEIIRNGNQAKIIWYNMNVVAGTNVAAMLQYGHGTGTGGWVPGRDYINPAMSPVFADAITEVMEEVKM